MNSEQDKSIGLRIREMRHSKGMTQEDLAEDLCISTKYLGNLELGKQSMSVSILLRLVHILSTSPNYLLGFDVEIMIIED
jgi:repressor LexA